MEVIIASEIKRKTWTNFFNHRKLKPTITSHDNEC